MEIFFRMNNPDSAASKEISEQVSKLIASVLPKKEEQNATTTTTTTSSCINHFDLFFFYFYFSFLYYLYYFFLSLLFGITNGSRVSEQIDRVHAKKQLLQRQKRASRLIDSLRPPFFSFFFIA
jgi:hypothetical protein